MNATRPAPPPDDDGTAGAALALRVWWGARHRGLARDRARLTRRGGAGGRAGAKELRDVDAELRKAADQLGLWRWLHATRGREVPG